MNKNSVPGMPRNGLLSAVAGLQQASNARAMQQQKPPQGLFCLYSKRSCHQNRLDGSEYCLKHILEDKNAPYRQCNFISPNNGKRCGNPAPKSEKMKGEGFCFEHARKAKSRSGASADQRGRGSSEDPAVGLLSRLSDQYLGDALIPTPKSAGKTATDLPPIPKSWAGPESRAAKALEMESDTDSDGETALTDAAWRGDAESDAESVDSEQEDQLKTAGTFTAEEVALITREKLIRLQTLYIEQFKRLQHVMQEKRRKLLSTRSMEKTKYGSIYGAKTDGKEKKRLERYRAFKRYHKRSGKEGLLQRQLNERRTRVQGPAYKPPPHPKCAAVVVENGEEAASSSEGARKFCGEKIVPCSKFCLRHIVLDPQQRLFVSCRARNTDENLVSNFIDGNAGSASTAGCAVAVPNVYTQPPHCPLHKTLDDDRPFESLIHLLKAEINRRNVKTEPGDPLLPSSASSSSSCPTADNAASSSLTNGEVGENSLTKIETTVKEEILEVMEEGKDLPSTPTTDDRRRSPSELETASTGSSKVNNSNGDDKLAKEVFNDTRDGNISRDHEVEFDRLQKPNVNGRDEIPKEKLPSIRSGGLLDVGDASKAAHRMEFDDPSLKDPSLKERLDDSKKLTLPGRAIEDVGTGKDVKVEDSAAKSIDAAKNDLKDDPDEVAEDIDRAQYAMDTGTQTTLLSLSFQSSNGTDESFDIDNDSIDAKDKEQL